MVRRKEKERKKVKLEETLKNDALVAKIGIDTAENEHLKGHSQLRSQPHRHLHARCNGYLGPANPPDRENR